jgi:hypothetical protein
MKVTAKLELGRDFDKKLREKINKVVQLKGKAGEPDAEQELVTEVRRLTVQAFKLGLNGAVE